MSSWRESILDQFVPGISRLTIASDPDNILTEEKLSTELISRGYDLLDFTDPIEFRYTYESKYRPDWNSGKQGELIVLVRDGQRTPEELPYDLLTQSRLLSFSISDLFPEVNFTVLEALDRSKLDALDEAIQRHSPGEMGENNSKDFVLRVVYMIVPEVIGDEVSLLHTLLRLHYSAVKLPDMLADRATHLIKSSGRFAEWDVGAILKSDIAFFEFLQERWPVFLSSKGATLKEKDSASSLKMSYNGPRSLPFDHPEIRVYIDNLFVEGKLEPVDATLTASMSGSWIQVGVLQPAETSAASRINSLWDIIKNSIPDQDARYSDWQSFAFKWAEFSSLYHRFNRTDEVDNFHPLQEEINSNYTGWLWKSYASLATLPPINPVMVHHIPRHLAREIEQDHVQKVALIVLDGLALDQWITIRDTIQLGTTRFFENTAFAWIPTLTSISRQAIFSGKIPLHFPESLWSTNKEEKLWEQFWESEGIASSDVVYRRGLGVGNPAAIIEETIHPTQTKIVGLVIDTVDGIMHGMKLGASGMHSQIEHWCKNRYLEKMIQILLDLEFNVWLTADHGNVECLGIGKPTEGSIAESRGSRTRVYPTASLRTSVSSEYPSAINWKQTGLPTECFPLVFGNSNAFEQKGLPIVAHGGNSIEEVMVPFIRLSRGNA